MWRRRAGRSAGHASSSNPTLPAKCLVIIWLPLTGWNNSCSVLLRLCSFRAQFLSQLSLPAACARRAICLLFLFAVCSPVTGFSALSILLVPYPCPLPPPNLPAILEGTPAYALPSSYANLNSPPNWSKEKWFLPPWLAAMLHERPSSGAPPRLDYFTFSIDDRPFTKLCFDVAPPKISSRQGFKRLRARNDVDGEGSENMQKKKRRLRRDLITSRLSRPYATPSSYIASRGASHIAKRGRQRLPGRNVLLRKAAIINWTRIRSIDKTKHDQIKMQKQLLEDFRRYNDKRNMIVQNDQRPPSPYKNSSPSPPRSPPSRSPLRISNYDVFDLEGDPYDENDDRWDDMGEEAVNSNFNKRLSTDVALNEYDAFPSTEFDMNAVGSLKVPTSHLIKLVTEEEKQNEISIAQFGLRIGVMDV